MKKRGSILKIFVIFALILVMVMGISLTAMAQSPMTEEDYDESDAGSFYLYTTDANGSETLYGELFYDRYVSTKTIELTKVIQSVRLVKNSGYEVNIDELTLNGAAPAGYERKLSATDRDLIELEDEKSFELSGSGTLVISARAPMTVAGPEYSFRFPESNFGRKITADSECYTYEMDSKLATLASAEEIPYEKLSFQSVMARPASGHPEAPINYYVANDETYLYVYAEVFCDNTFDHGKDHSGVYVLCGDEVKYFAVYTTDENEYGSWAFKYTDSDPDYDYEHMEYLVRIPRAEIADAGDNVSLVFEYYGTATAYVTPFYLSFKKIDQNSNPLKGAVFNISACDATGEFYNGYATSDKDGVVSFEFSKGDGFFVKPNVTLKTPEELEELWQPLWKDYWEDDWEVDWDESREGQQFDGYIEADGAMYSFWYIVNDGKAEITDQRNMNAYIVGDKYSRRYWFPFDIDKWVSVVDMEQVNGDELPLILSSLTVVVTETEAPAGYKTLGQLSSLSFTYDDERSDNENIYMVGTVDVINELVTIDIPVTKVWNDSGDQDELRPGEITFTLYADGEETNQTLTLDKNSADASGNWTGKFENLPKYDTDGTEIKYSIKENEISDYTNEISGSMADGFTVTNTHKSVGNLKVSKAVTGNDADHDKEFNFTVTLGDTTISGAYGDMTFANGVANFTLKDGETATAEGLPHGTSYTVTETNYSADGYDTTFTGETGTIVGKGVAEAKFTNTRNTYGSLTISKTVEGNAGDTDKEFHFNITLSDTTISGTYGDVTFNSGVGEFTLKHGGTVSVVGLPNGITYTITEDDYSGDGYVTDKTGETGTIVGNSTLEAKFTNTRDACGKLTVSKTVAGTYGSKSKQFTFTVTLSDTTINGTYGDMTFVNGVATFTLKHGKTMTAEGIPVGVTYIVTEADYSSSGYVTTKSGATGTIEEATTAAAKFTNTRNTGTSTPTTGDSRNIALWLTISILSLAGIATVVVTDRKKAKH